MVVDTGRVVDTGPGSHFALHSIRFKPTMEPWLETFARASFQRSADVAHDLKTPLNVAVLNLELLRMRLVKLGVDGDAKVEGYSRSIEIELRRMGKIFDAFFILSTPPKSDEQPAPADIAAIAADVAEAAGIALAAEPAILSVHEARIRQAFELFFDGAGTLLEPAGREIRAEREAKAFAVVASGRPASPDLELSKLFKLYYTDSEGNPDLSFAVARLIAETYGGELKAEGDRDKVTVRLSFPLGD